MMIRWGILGAGKIAHRFAGSLSNQKDSELYAISGRNPEKLDAFHEKHPCKRIYAGHENMLDDPDVDCIYLSLPHHMHAQWAIKAMEAEKAVLCEKPAVMNAQEMEQIIEASKRTGVLFMEAMKPRFVPAYTKLKELLASGIIGEIKEVSAENCFLLPEAAYGKSYHTIPGQGGALLDMGCHNVSLLNDLCKGDVKVVSQEYIEGCGVDMYSDTVLEIGGIKAECRTGFDRNTGALATVEGSKGKIVIEHPHRPDVLHVFTEGKEETFAVGYENDDFFSQIDAFCTLLKEGKKESDIMSLEDSLRNAQIMDTIRNVWEK